jgi:hypothetical protein
MLTTLEHWALFCRGHKISLAALSETAKLKCPTFARLLGLLVVLLLSLLVFSRLVLNVRYSMLQSAPRSTQAPHEATTTTYSTAPRVG